ncbi:MAG TPA: LamG-like jellyroll fold domain-containing protein [Actinocrinis sp.]|uniref:LamG-like jellyroll fold domain-containing protein n=1 Tax=Actinocrinis sp. TaxID=1920516 RepID=UPI002DDD6439|nr:LamG-like jellyroll fold domain-containing protein [Actinocrinis sp.]HEV3173537.1 LamG-like jellyroll fold domain-containing protein [Actinocrinis sp.]
MDHEHDTAPDGCAGHDCPRTADFDSAGPAATGRRAFLRTTGLLGAGVATLGLGSGVLAPAPASASAASDPYDVTTVAEGTGSGGRWRPDTESPRFTLVVMPDTQYLFDQDRIHPAPLEASLRYVLDPGDDQNIVFLAHLGDVTQNGLAEEYAAAGPVFEVLDQKNAAYSVIAGNHDVSGDDQRGATPYLDTFNPARFAHSPAYGGSSPDGYNHYHVFRAGGREWLLLGLDWRLSPAGFAWANSVLAAHPSLPAIVTTHEIAYADDSGQAYLSSYGQQLWDGLIKDNDQIFLTLNGHYWPPGSTTLQNTAGNDVHVHITNYQNRYYGGAAMIRTYRFDTDRDTVDVATFSPWIRDLAEDDVNKLASQEIDLTGAVDYFSIPLDFVQRFAKFAPVPPRPPRPAGQMLVRGTLAYWRFDSGNADGSAVADNVVVKDLTGLGNDLVKTTVPGSPGTPLTWSSAFHPDQPGHGSLYFAGQGNPLQGAYLQTVPSAPLNAETFERGYTFEAFFKLPADWDSSQNAWTAMLSRWGMSGEAGKHGGATDPQEPIVTLSLSGDRELQWCVYPLDRTDSSTNWGHELPLDAWWHVAVVNDGTLTKMYVDGCELVRNPSTPAVGLTTLLHSWLLGGYEYAGTINQIFHGYIGDVRVVNRPLKTSQFMNA